MAEIRRDGTVVFDGYTGLRNTTQPDRFEDGELAVAQNVDIDSEKVLMRRTGLSSVVAGTFSSFAGDGNGLLFAVSNGSLLQVFPDGTTAVLRTGITAGVDVSYTFQPGRTYWSNGLQNGIVEPAGNRSWGIAKPVTCGSAAQIGGNLRDGRYLWTLSYRRRDGQLSGSSADGLITLSSTGPIRFPAPNATANQGGIRLTNIPVSADPTVVYVEVYITDPDGETLYRRGVIPNGVTTYDYVTQTNSQVPHRARNLDPAPLGTPVGYAFGRSFVAVDRLLYYSEPNSPELFDLRKYIAFESPVTIIAPAADGMYIGTEQNVSWHGGRNPEDWVYLRKTTYGAIRGTLSFVPADWFTPKGDGDATVFMTALGWIVAQNGGVMVNLTQDKFLMPIQERGVTISRKYRGYNQLLAFMQGVETAAPSAS